MAIDVWKWISNFIPHFTGNVLTILGLNLIHTRKWGAEVKLGQLLVTLCHAWHEYESDSIDITFNITTSNMAYSLGYPLWIYGAVCLQFAHFLCDDYHQISSMNYYPFCLGLSHEKMVYAACLCIFLGTIFCLFTVTFMVSLQAFWGRWGFVRGLSMAFRKRWEFPSVKLAHNSLGPRHSLTYI